MKGQEDAYLSLKINVFVIFSLFVQGDYLFLTGSLLEGDGGGNTIRCGIFDFVLGSHPHSSTQLSCIEDSSENCRFILATSTGRGVFRNGRYGKEGRRHYPVKGSAKF